MNRLAVVAVLGLTSLIGCAHRRSVMPGVGPIDPLASAPIAPIGQTINAGFAPTDPSLQQAAYPASNPKPLSPTPTPPAASARAAGPFTVPTPAAVVPQPIPVQPPPVEAPAELPPQAPLPPPEDRQAQAHTKAPAPTTAAAPQPSPPTATTALPELPIPNTPPVSALVPTIQVVRPRVDPTVQTTATTSDPSQVRIPGAKKKPTRRDAPVTQIAATVGTEEITRTELQRAVQERLQMMGGRKVPNDQVNELARMTLDELIQRSMLIQAAKHKLKDEKNWAKMLKHFEGAWYEQELPQLIQKHNLADEAELDQYYKNRGQSLKAIREDFKLRIAAMEFLRSQILPKTKVGLPEMRAYYDANLHSFDRRALIHWREVEVKVANHKDRAEARAKAEAALARLRRGDSFDAVARATSEGTNAKKGGVWETSPDSVGIPAINDALNTLPVQQTSSILEAPDSYHILVVESRRPAGPATFSEVQEKIHKAITERKFREFSDEYFDKLRGQTLITSMFDGTASSPTLSNFQNPAGTTSRR